MLLVVQREQHGEAMKSWYMLWYRRSCAGADAAVLALDAHVGAREERGGEADERRERHQEHVERIDEELLVAATSRFPSPMTRAVERARGDEGGEAERDVELRGAQRGAPNSAEQQRAGERNAEQTQAGYSTLTVLLQRLEVVQVEAVELLADLEEEHAEDEHRRPARRARRRARRSSACRRWRSSRRRTGRSPSTGSRPPATSPCGA